MEPNPFHHPWKQRRLPGYDYANPDHAIFVTIRAHGSSVPFTDHRLAQEVLSSLEWLRVNRGVSIYAYCLMPDHLHLLLRLVEGGQTLGFIIGSFKRFTTRQSWKYGYKGALWQARFYDHILRKSEDGEQVAQYILANPVRKGLVSEASKYPYSGMPDPM